MGQGKAGQGGSIGVVKQSDRQAAFLNLLTEPLHD